MSPFKPPQPPQDFHSWPTADASAYHTFIEALQEIAKRNVVVTEDMASEMSSYITYLGTKPTARDQGNWYPPFSDESREGFAEVLLSLPSHLPQALVGGCRKAWKAFAKSAVSQSDEEIENDKAALTSDVPAAPLLLSAVEF